MRPIISAAAASLAIAAGPVLAQDGDMGFGTEEDVAYAEQLWDLMEAERLAGRVARGMDEGCIACHQGAVDDLVFTSDHLIAN